MTYITNGEYSSTDDGYLIGYKLITADYRAPNYHEFIYTQGKVVGHRPGEKRKGFLDHVLNGKYPGDGIHHCCTQDELKKNWLSNYMNSDGLRLVRLLIHPDDMVKKGVCYRAYVDMISPIMFQWGVFSPEGSLAPDLPPVTELAKKKLNAGLSADEVISVVMTPAPELVKAEKADRYTLKPITNFPSNPYFTQQ